MMKKILLPTDFSDNAWNALFTAVKLYANEKCKFFLLHAYEPYAINKLGRKNQQRLGVIYDSLAENSRRELNKIMEYIHKNHDNANHQFETLSLPETLDEAIDKIVTEHDIELVVMGTQGATGAKEVFMGSNTVRILKKLKTKPILVVPSGYDFQNLKKAAFPTDFARTYEKFELLPLTELLTLWNAELEVWHISLEDSLNEIQEANKKLLQKRLAEHIHTFKNVEFNMNVAHSITNYLSDNTVDLIALIRYHHTFWEKVIGEPVAKKMAFHSSVPVLIFSEHRQ